MAQTKRKRRTKHRGNAAGMVETRGRTGRKLTPEERKKDAKQLRQDRMNKPPSWRSATTRAAFAAAFFVVALILLFKEPIPNTLALGAVVLLMYIPLGFYTDQYIYKRRIARQGKS